VRSDNWRDSNEVKQGVNYKREKSKGLAVHDTFVKIRKLDEHDINYE